MGKIIIVPNSLEDIKLFKDKVDGYIIGINGLSINSNYNIDDLNILKLISDKEIFINIDKNLHNSDLNKVKDILIELNNYNIKAVMYYDVAVLNIYKGLNLKYDLVWNQEHATTNYNTINYWYDEGVKYTYISSDITLNEIKEIVNNTKSKLMMPCFGYLPMFVSKRHAVKNYLDYFNLNDNSKINYIEKENKIYPIIDNELGTKVYSNNILNSILFINKISVDYFVLNEFNIDSTLFLQIIDMFKNVNKDSELEYEDKINSLFNNINHGFLNTKTIYRVKK